MSDLNLVLVEPQIPQNTGNVARTCAVTGSALHLVKPMGFEIDDRKLKRAGLDYWDKLDITYYDSLDSFLKINSNESLYFFSTKAYNSFSGISYPKRCFLVFGKETAGLPPELIRSNPERSVRIPMRDSLRCLNLSNSVAIGAYEVLRQWGYPGLTNDPAFRF